MRRRRSAGRDRDTPRAAGASGQTPERQHLDRHLADKRSQRELQGAREVGESPRAPLSPIPPGEASPGCPC